MLDVELTAVFIDLTKAFDTKSDKKIKITFVI